MRHPVSQQSIVAAVVGLFVVYRLHGAPQNRMKTLCLILWIYGWPSMAVSLSGTFFSSCPLFPRLLYNYASLYFAETSLDHPLMAVDEADMYNIQFSQSECGFVRFTVGLHGAQEVVGSCEYVWKAHTHIARSISSWSPSAVARVLGLLQFYGIICLRIDGHYAGHIAQAPKNASWALRTMLSFIFMFTPHWHFLAPHFHDPVDSNGAY